MCPCKVPGCTLPTSSPSAESNRFHVEVLSKRVTELNPLPKATEADARIAVDDLLRQAGWDPRDKSHVGTEINVGPTPALTNRSQARPFETHAPVFDLIAAAGNFGSDRL